MNMMNSDYEEQNFEYRFDADRGREPSARRGGVERPAKKGRAQYSRTNRPVVMHNGIHRRRNKRFSW